MGIGESLSITLAKAGARLILISRDEKKLKGTVEAVQNVQPTAEVYYYVADIQDHQLVKNTVDKAVAEHGHIDCLINNAGLALGSPKRFDQISIGDTLTMNRTNIDGTMFMTHAVLNASMITRGTGTILSLSSVTALEAPPAAGEAVYHSNKLLIEGFSNALRNELVGSDIRVLVIRPGIVDTNFHQQRVGYDSKQHDEFFAGIDPLQAQDIADAIFYMINQPTKISIKALDIVPTAQRSLAVLDRNWTSRADGRTM